MTKRLARSSEILDRADSFEDKMNHILFYTEQNARIWAPRVEGEWYPGDFLYAHPSERTDAECPRQIIQEFDIDHFNMHMQESVSVFGWRCTDCMVDWEDYEPCWACGLWPKGEMGPRPKPANFNLGPSIDFSRGQVSIGNVRAGEVAFEPIGYIDEVHLDDNGVTFTGHVNPGFDAFADAARSAGRAMTEFRMTLDDHMRPVIAEIQRNLREEYERIIQRSLYGDMHLHFDIARLPEPEPWQRYTIDHWIGPTYEAERTIFEEPDIRGPLYDTAALYDPRERSEWGVPIEIREMVSEINIERALESEVPPVPRLQLMWDADYRRYNSQPHPDATPINQQRRN